MSKKIIRLTAAALVIVLAFTAGGCGKKIDPVEYTGTAWENTFALMDVQRPELPDPERFMGGPVRQGIHFRLVDTDIPDAQEMIGASLDLDIKLDAENKKALIEGGAGMGGMSITGNSLFISPEMVALNVPFLYSGAPYVTADPRTFEEDWNGSFFAQLTPLPEGLSIPATIDGFFSFMPQATEQEHGDTPAQTLRKANLTLLGDRAIGAPADEELTVGENTVKVKKFEYTIPAEALNAYYTEATAPIRDALDDMQDSITDLTERAVVETGAEDMEQGINDLRTVINSFKFDENMALLVYIDDKQLVRKVAASGLHIVYTDENGEDQGGLADYEIVWSGEGNLYDRSDVKIVLTDAEVVATIDGRSEKSESRIAEYWEMKMNPVDGEAGNAADNNAAKFAFEWEPGVTDSDNMRFELDTDQNGGNVSVSVTGNMLDTTDEFSFTNGEVSVKAQSGYVDAKFGYNVSAISAQDVNVDVSGAKRLFDFDFNDLLEIAGGLGLY